MFHTTHDEWEHRSASWVDKIKDKKTAHRKNKTKKRKKHNLILPCLKMHERDWGGKGREYLFETKTYFGIFEFVVQSKENQPLSASYFLPLNLIYK